MISPLEKYIALFNNLNFSSILCALAGWFSYTGILLVFADASGKFSIIFICFALPALAFLLLGLAISKFQNWKGKTGKVLIWMAALSFLMEIGIFYLERLDPAMRTASLQGSINAGAATLAIIFIIGFFFDRAKKVPEDQALNDHYTLIRYQALSPAKRAINIILFGQVFSLILLGVFISPVLVAAIKHFVQLQFL